MSLTKEKGAALSEELPYWDFIGGPLPHMVLTDGSLSAGLKVNLCDIECLDDSEVNQFVSGLRSSLNSVSEGSSVQFMLSVTSDYTDVLKKHIDAKSSAIHPLVDSIAKFRETKLKQAAENSELYRPELTIFIRSPMTETKKKWFFRKKSEFSDDATKAYEDTLEVLSQNIASLTSSFGGHGLKSIVLDREALIAKAYRFLNPKRVKSEPIPLIITPSNPDLDAELLQDAEWLANQSPREQVVFGDLVLDFEHFTLNSFQHRTVTLKTLPEITYAGQLSSFLRLPFHYDLILSLTVPPQSDEMAKLQQKRKMAHSLAATSGGKAVDLESETKLSSTEELIRELLNTGQRIYAAQMTILLRAPNNEAGTKKLSREVREVLSRFRALNGAEGLEESVGSWKVVKGSLPGAPINLERVRKIKTNNLADFLPMYGPREGDNDPVVIFRNRLNGLVSFNPFDPGLVNYNTLVTGSSGAGKSFMNNSILLQELTRNERVFIIDIGGSYKKLTHALGGQYLEINLSDDYKLNPFDIPDPTQEPSSDKLKSILAIIELMVAEDEQSKLPKLDRVLLEKAVIELYEEKRKKKEMPTLTDLSLKLSQSEEPAMKTFAKLLFSWTGSRPFGKLLDGQGSLRTNANICAFDLKGLSKNPDLQAVMTLIITSFILAEVERDKSCRKRIIIDEAWQLLKSQSSANFMEYCARTLRKTGSGITFITQGVDEIVSSPIGPAILNCTATKFVLLQTGDSKILSNALKLNDQQLSLIQSLIQKKGEFSEIFMIEGDSRQVVRIYPSPFEYWLSTSDPQDNQYLDELKNKGLDLVSAIEEAAKQYPNGIAKGRSEGLREVA